MNDIFLLDWKAALGPAPRNREFLQFEIQRYYDAPRCLCLIKYCHMREELLKRYKALQAWKYKVLDEPSMEVQGIEENSPPALYLNYSN